jgi:hypothetical protein
MDEGAAMTLSDDVLDAGDSWLAAVEYLEREHLTDGLPVIPPVPELVERAVAWTGRSPDEVIGKVAPQWSPATVAKIAANVVMAGCEPKHLPVVIAAVQGITDPAFNLYSVQATTNPGGPFVVVNGPSRDALGVHYGAGALGPGFRANATIGRALRLVMMNIGGARPGELDQATLGFPGKFTMCVAENQEANPWEPYHVERGWNADDDTAMVSHVNATVNVFDSESRTPEGLLRTLAGSIGIQGTNNFVSGGQGVLFVLLSPEWASTLAGGGWTKQTMREYLWDTSAIPLDQFSPDVAKAIETKYRKAWLDDGRVRVTELVERIHFVVVGGHGRHTTLVFSPHNAPLMKKIAPPAEIN